MKTEYPLKWPDNIPPRLKQIRSGFRNRMSILQAIAELESALKKYGASGATLYTNMKFDSVGEPLPLKGKPVGAGVSLTFISNNNQVVMACDKYDRIADNIRAMAETIFSYYKIKNYGTKFHVSRPYQSERQSIQASAE